MNTTWSAITNCKGWLIPCDSVILKSLNCLQFQHFSESLGKTEQCPHGRQPCEAAQLPTGMSAGPYPADTPAHAQPSLPRAYHTHQLCKQEGSLCLCSAGEIAGSLSGEPLSKSSLHVNHCIFQSANVPGVEALHKANSEPFKTHLQQICKLHFKPRQEQRK